MQDRADAIAVAIRALLREQINASPAVRTLAVELAHWVLEEADKISDTPESTAEPDTADSPPAPKPVEPKPARPTIPQQSGVVPLDVGGAKVQIEVRGSRQDLAAAHESIQRADEESEQSDRRPFELDLDRVTTRARLKADACRLYIRRRSAEGDPQREPALVEQIHQMIEKGKSIPDCFLWVFWRYEVQPDDDRLLAIAECYDALADAASVCGVATSPNTPLNPREVNEAFHMLAEATSALRIALEWTWLTSPDHDQNESHLWLRRETKLRSIFVERHMTLTDPADPHRAAELRADIRRLRVQVEARKDQRKQIDALFNRIRYHAGRLPESGAGEEHDCKRINECALKLAEFGIRPNDERFGAVREVLRLDAFPESITPAPLLTSANAIVEAKPQPASESEPRWSERVLEAREMLGGGSIVIIGGEPRQDAIRRIADAFELFEVDWVPLEEHGTSTRMRAPIARPETRLVVVLIKLTGHLHAEEARSYARDFGKPCILLPAGYNPEQIAEHIHEQAAARLT
ncbi:MAG: hypothetical protein ACNA8P_01470 [Phycisphaerales bacterium]